MHTFGENDFSSAHRFLCRVGDLSSYHISQFLPMTIRFHFWKYYHIREYLRSPALGKCCLLMCL